MLNSVQIHQTLHHQESHSWPPSQCRNRDLQYLCLLPHGSQQAPACFHRRFCEIQPYSFRKRKPLQVFSDNVPVQQFNKLILYIFLQVIHSEVYHWLISNIWIQSRSECSDNDKDNRNIFKKQKGELQRVYVISLSSCLDGLETVKMDWTMATPASFSEQQGSKNTKKYKEGGKIDRWPTWGKGWAATQPTGRSGLARINKITN